MNRHRVSATEPEGVHESTAFTVESTHTRSGVLVVHLIVGRARRHLCCCSPRFHDFRFPYAYTRTPSRQTIPPTGTVKSVLCRVFPGARRSPTSDERHWLLVRARVLAARRWRTARIPRRINMPTAPRGRTRGSTRVCRGIRLTSATSTSGRIVRTRCARARGPCSTMLTSSVVVAVFVVVVVR